MVSPKVEGQIIRELEENRSALREMESELVSLKVTQDDTSAQLRRFMQAVEQGPVAVVITDLDGQIEYVNPKFESITGYSASEVIGRNTSIFQSGETPAEVYQQLWKQIQSGEEWKGLFHNKKKNGDLFWLRSVISPVKDSLGDFSHYVAVQEDITLQRLAEKQQEEERLKFFHQSKMADIGLLAASILHEVGSPIASIHGLIDGLLNKSTDTALDSEDRDNLTHVLGLTNRLMSITHEISDFTSPHSGNLELVDLNGVIRSTSHMAQFENRWKSINLTLDLDPNLPALMGYKDQLTHLILNLLVNAADAVQDTKNKQFNIRVKTQPESDGIFLCVSDNGCGMAREIREHATDAFYTTKLPGHGTGLGLSLCQSIINNHHGRLDIQSIPNNGTDMNISFPLKTEV